MSRDDIFCFGSSVRPTMNTRPLCKVENPQPAVATARNNARRDEDVSKILSMSTGAKECGFEKKNRDGHTCTKGYQTGIRITLYTVYTPGTLIPKVCTVM